MKRTTITAVIAALALCGLAVAVESRSVAGRADVSQSRLQVPAARLVIQGGDTDSIQWHQMPDGSGFRWAFPGGRTVPESAWEQIAWTVKNSQ